MKRDSARMRPTLPTVFCNLKRGTGLADVIRHLANIGGIQTPDPIV
jgi:urease accessory protein